MNIEESKKDIYNELRIAADVDNEFLEDSFVEYVEKLCLMQEFTKTFKRDITVTITLVFELMAITGIP